MSSMFFDTYQVEHLSLLNERVKAVHHLFDASLPIPPVDIEDVDVRRPQFLQARFDTHVHRFHAVSRVQHLLLHGSLPLHII